ncbi:hypothetical protein [Pedobacter chitinilyticus]|uniref:Uncharacterized protein n=1 Tax=Pedobacter chitinilyticus TaxID=2233776 RepID=A0A443YNQ2_9SPHI|nr:hypothetical protein [Pedobacter chitinilyticus]RWU05421.1 hypothetical protein DPV69_14800 [Pedobacter chitinilyticus]
MRILFRAFAFLDLFSLAFMTMQLVSIVNNFAKLTLLSDKVQSILMFPMYLLVAVGAYGLFFQKKIGFISYYIQFPFRLYLWVLSLGFITLLPEAFSNYDDKWFPILLKVCYVGEFIRLYLTIKAHYDTVKA